MTAAGDEEARRAGRARAVALFRYSLIREAADPGLSTRQRGRLVRELAAQPHAGPFGEPVRVSRASLDRWIRAWRAGGSGALMPPARQVTPRTPAEVLALAAALKRENPARTAAQVARILRTSAGWSASWPPASMPGRSASRSGCRGPAWTGGSGPGGLAGSTR